MLRFISHLRSEIEKINKRPDDITRMLKAPTIEEIKHMQKWLKAHNDLKKLSSIISNIRTGLRGFPNLALQLGYPDLEPNFPTSSLEIEKENELRQWLRENKALVKAHNTFVFWAALLQALRLPPPPGIENVITLEDVINLAGQFPAWFHEHREALAQLTQLGISSRNLTSLPIEIGALTGLTELDLSGNNLTELPSGIDRLTNLAELDLSDNCLTSIPPTIGNLPHLQILDLRGNQLSNLPAELGKLSKLLHLDVRGNQLRSLPKQIGELRELTNLILSGNQIQELPSTIGQLGKILEIGLSFNYLSSLPIEMSQLNSLKILNLHDNIFTSFPLEQIRLPLLEDLCLARNFITSLPSVIGEFPQMEHLYISHNRLISLAPEIGKLTRLKLFDCSNNRLTDLPSELLQHPNYNRSWHHGSNPLSWRFKIRTFIPRNATLKNALIGGGLLAVAYGVYSQQEMALNALSFTANKIGEFWRNSTEVLIA